MSHCRIILGLFTACITYGQIAATSELQAILGFEDEPVGTTPRGWNGTPVDTVLVDDQVVHSGKRSVRIERTVNSARTYSTVTKTIPIAVAGRIIELTGFLRTKDVSDFAGLMLREDGENPGIAFENMQRRKLNGTHDWAEFSVSLPLDSNATSIYFGVLASGTGITWADDLRLLVDGKPIEQASKIDKPKTPIDLDHQFDHGSGITVGELTRSQVENLATLGKVWGFLKYHHPAVTSGGRHWDYDLFRVLPAVLAAPDRAVADAALLQWINDLGPVNTCKPCAVLDPKKLHLQPDIQWISDERFLGKELAARLRTIYDNRLVGLQFYLSLVPGIGKPKFEHELSYSNGLTLPDPGFQLLGLFRFWNIIKYWSPYRDLVGEDWDEVLMQFIPRIALAQTERTYYLELTELVVQVHDTHARLTGPPGIQPPLGNCHLPIDVRFIENRAVVAAIEAAEPKLGGRLKRGDIITELDGQPVLNLVRSWAPYYAASNEAARLRWIAESAMLRGVCGDSELRIQRGTETLKVRVTRRPGADPKFATHDLPGDTFRLLSDEVGYLKLSSVKAADAAAYINRVAKAKGLIVDVRNYPSEFVVFALGELLVDKKTDFVKGIHAELSNPGAFYWHGPNSLIPRQPHYAGKVVILVDETTQSDAEYTSMALRASPHAVVVGSTTAGADGNVSGFSLPGKGISTQISGLGIFYPDGRPTQRIGIVPDVEVLPTIDGIGAGRDEVMEVAIGQILGVGTPISAIDKLIPR